MRHIFRAFLCALILVPGANSVRAADGKPAVSQVRTLARALISAMQAGPTLPTTKRYRALEPVIEQVFALPFMTRLSVGPAWASFSPQQQKILIGAFSRYTIANYAHNFRAFSGQSFVVDPRVVTRGEDKIVQTSITSPGATPARLLYRMRAIDGSWRIVDVYYNGVSQLTLHRVQFASAIGSGGGLALIAYLDRVSDALMK